MNRTVITGANGNAGGQAPNTNPFGGFTTLGAIVVVILLIAFIRNKAVTIFLGVLLLAYLLINTNKIIPMFFNGQISSNVLGNMKG